MDAWDEYIFGQEASGDFLDELSTLDDDDIIDAVADACTLVIKDPTASEDEVVQGQAAATIAAIWAGAPFSAGDVVAEYPFIRSLMGRGSEELYAAAGEILEGIAEDDSVDESADVESFAEALASAD